MYDVYLGVLQSTKNREKMRVLKNDGKNEDPAPAFTNKYVARLSGNCPLASAIHVPVTCAGITLLSRIS